jgi:hypothetical protein
MLLRDGIVKLRQKGASLQLIRELLATVGVAVGTDTIARFLAEVNGERNHSKLLNDQVAHATSEAKRPTRDLWPLWYPPLRRQPLQPHRNHHLLSQLQPRTSRRHPSDHAVAAHAL